MNALHWPLLQDSMAGALLDPHAGTPACLTTRVGHATASRFDVYRNNVHSSLIEALVAAFPVTAKLVSEESFRALARQYLRADLPASAALLEYGSGLPDFIRAWDADSSPPYLADIAGLEHVWWQCYGAADAPALALRELAAPDPEALLHQRARLHPATRLVRSEHPVHAIWTAHQAGGEPSAPASWDPQCVLVTRPAADVQVRTITTAQHDLLAALATGATLEAAAGTALARDPVFDLGATLRLVIEAGAIQELY